MASRKASINSLFPVLTVYRVQGQVTEIFDLILFQMSVETSKERTIFCPNLIQIIMGFDDNG